MDEINKNQVSLDTREINLIELIIIYWRHKFFILFVTFIFAITSLFYALSLPNIYQSSSLVSAQDGSMGLDLGGYSGLAAIAGINLPSSSGDKSDIVLETIRSREFLKHLISFEEVLPALMAAKEYDFLSQQIIYDNELYDTSSGDWVREVEPPFVPSPSYLEAHESYLGSFSAYQIPETGFIVLSFEHVSPIFAYNFLSLIISEINKWIMQKDLDESSKALNYLNDQASKTSLTNINSSISNLIESNLETQMRARSNDDYALSIIDPPFIPELKSKPSRKLILILGTLIGGLLSLLLVMINHYFIKKKYLHT